MVKRFQIIQVAEVTADDGIYYYTLDGLLIGGYQNGKLIETKQAGEGSNSGVPAIHTGIIGGGVITPPKPKDLKRQQEAQAERDITSLDAVLPRRQK